MDTTEQTTDEAAPVVRVASEYNKAPRGECEYCDREREAGNSYHPSHKARSSCRSGGHNHCTCDTCF